MRPKVVSPIVCAIAALLIGWEVTSRLAWVDPALLPPASMVLEALWALLRDDRFLADLAITGLEVLAAFGIAAPLALSSGFLLGERLHLGQVINPFIHFGLAVPQSIFLPIFILLFGIGFLSKVVFGMTHAYFVIVVTTVAAVRSVPAPMLLAARSFGATSGQIYLRVYLPYMLPLIVTGLRLGMILAVVGVLLAEMYASRRGIGGLILAWGERSEITQLLAGIVLISVLTIAMNEAMRFFEFRAARWQRAMSQAGYQ